MFPSHQPNIDCTAMCHGQNMPLFLAIGHYASLMVREDHPAIFHVYHPTVDRHMYVFLAGKIR